MLFLNNIKLKYKLFLVYIFCVFCPIVLINIVFYHNMVYNVREIQKNYYRLSTQQIVSRIENDLDLVTLLCNKISFDQKLYEMMERRYLHEIDYVEAYYNYFVDYLFLNGESYRQVNTAVLYTDNESILHSGSVCRIDDNMKSKKWFKQVLKEPEKMHIIFGETRVRSNNEVVTPISIVKVLNVYSGLDKYLKIIKMNINTKKIINNITDGNLRGNLLIIDDNQRLLFAEGKLPEGLNVDGILKENKEQIITGRINKGQGWTVINVMDQRQINEALRKPRNNIILLTVFSLLLASAIIILISRSFYNRINALSEHVNSMNSENFSRQYTGPQGKDEIGTLIKAFNEMIVRIKTLIKDIYEAKLEQSRIKLEKKQAELNTLQSQMNPHFLYNTLESIRMKSLEKGERETAGVIKQLARSFQRMISLQPEWVKLSEEIDFIKDFLKIQKYRFGSELEYFLDVDPAVLDYRIPKLIIQPFVENACIHGVEGSEEIGRIKVKIQLIDNDIKTVISDNGIGMTENKLQSLLKDLKNYNIQESNIAIKNIYQRLNLYYGDKFDLKITSKKGEGTVITLLIPVEDSYHV